MQFATRPNWIPAWTMLCTTLLSPVAVSATGNAPGLPSSPIGSPALLNIGGGLLVVILAIIVLGVVYARTQGLRNGSNGVINIVATQTIGPKERIAVIEVADKQLLIGMTTTSVQTLHVFDEPVAPSAAPRASFAERLKSALKGEGK